VVPDSSIFVARKPCKKTYSNEKLFVNRLNVIRELQKMKIRYSRMRDVSMMRDRFLNK
jgi:hypothetical protein